MAKKQNLSSIDPWLEPFAVQLQQRVDHAEHLKRRLLGGETLQDFALGHDYFGLHKTPGGWVFREWAPNATKIYIVGEFSDWQDREAYSLTTLLNGQWEITLPPENLHHESIYKLHIHWPGGDGYRIPAWSTRLAQDPQTHDFSAQVWDPDSPYSWKHDDVTPTTTPLLVYEAHIGMASEQPHVASYVDFTRDVLSRVKASGYNTLQLMAIQEHPYYGSFGYHVSSFFAASSRFGTPDELKELIDTAHGMGITVILDLVHSHAVKNELEGLSRFDGSYNQYFHAGDRGTHGQWDSRVFDYGKSEVAHFLLSNCRFWLDEYHFDGFRFDGVTSMLYTHHGMEKTFGNYDDYFTDTDPDAFSYLRLANELIHTIRPHAITIAEDMSGMPGIAGLLDDGGAGFDYRLNMGIPDMWIKYIKEVRDEDWNMSHLFHELTSHRPEEHTINYAESHDQALVGDKTIMFRLADKDMYDHMLVDDPNIEIERAIALHKMIRLLTASTNHGGYLNFMGNEFGHPEWIDFPREGNDWSYKYAKRQWKLADNPKLKYTWLNAFDMAMTHSLADIHGDIENVHISDGDHVISFTRGKYVFVFNFHPQQSHESYSLPTNDNEYNLHVSTDNAIFGGQNRIDPNTIYRANDTFIKVYIPARTANIYKIVDNK